jgi:hypothetical protein
VLELHYGCELSQLDVVVVLREMLCCFAVCRWLLEHVLVVPVYLVSVECWWCGAWAWAWAWWRCSVEGAVSNWRPTGGQWWVIQWCVWCVLLGDGWGHVTKDRVAQHHI